MLGFGGGEFLLIFVVENPHRVVCVVVRVLFYCSYDQQLRSQPCADVQDCLRLHAVLRIQ